MFLVNNLFNYGNGKKISDDWSRFGSLYKLKLIYLGAGDGVKAWDTYNQISAWENVWVLEQIKNTLIGYDKRAISKFQFFLSYMIE